ncbi:calcium-responsive transcription factor [Brienomyrus brachyistius]|uniref:calcium-responsive transcription factor n=1 Tax=Brienomyrus brachyistius TaxID=42636 RepID=UPI0020B3235B|nr:calcium-responsive transcription factor [Brienomyrus brachyistius]XP_048872888.1 calcium-responsive transcription factor [Brienomyrus brachyistius]XP_048872898.1 calcium-responsive transcription factor [Brienomyrus brachyistius]
MDGERLMGAQEHPGTETGAETATETGRATAGPQNTAQVAGEISAQTSLDSEKLPVTLLVSESLPSEEKLIKRGDQRSQSEQFIVFDQNGQPLQYEHMVILTGQPESGLYVIPSSQLEQAPVLLPQGLPMDVAEATGPCTERSIQEQIQTAAVTTITEGACGVTVTTCPVTPTKIESSPPDCFQAPVRPLPPSAPSWAHRLCGCEKIGEAYRGFCTTEAELEAVLMLHKQQTHSVFGTRQSPSPAKPATRLMWKSQYVPYDGIPFVNAGSRAIVMECQFGPRRKGCQPKKVAESEDGQNYEYKATCPARIYIKKVRKFPEYRVSTDPKVDKKVVRQEQEKAFFNLKKNLWEAGGVLRYYVQLPTMQAHLYHDVDAPALPPPPLQLPLPHKEELLAEEEKEPDGRMEQETGDGEQGEVPSRLHPRVAEKICELVAQGHHQVYMVRKQLRKFVEREMFKSDEVPERHNLCYFPTVNDIKNHIHEAQKALQPSRADYSAALAETQWTAESENPLAETVTLTLTSAPVEVSQKAAVLEGSDTLSPEAVQLFSSLTSLQPKIFAQLRGIQLQPVLCPSEGPSAPPCSGSDLLGPSSPTQFLQSSASLTEGVSLTDTPTLLGMGPLVSVSVLGEGGADAGVQQILLGDAQAIPVQIVEPVIVGEHELVHTQVKEETEDGGIYPPHSPGD